MRIYIALVLSSLLLIYSMGVKKLGILKNNFTRFISGISMEIYLCHMVMYRILEKLHLLHVFENEIVSYVFAVILVFTSSIAFSLVAQKYIMILRNNMKEKSKICQKKN